MNEAEYLETIKLENEQHRQLMREDYLQYIESVKQAMLEIHNSENALRSQLICSALNGYLASGFRTDTSGDKRVLCRRVLELTDIMLDEMESELVLEPMSLPGLR